MDKDKTNIERIVLLTTGVVTAIAGLFAAFNGLYDKFRNSVEIFAGFEKWQLGAAALVLVAFGIWLIRLSRRRRSVLLRPEALRLGRDNPAHLVGRAQDIADLARLCREQSLVFLEGESGAGKSALLQAGLVSALKGDPELLPIYVESLVGADWERDPRRFLAAALRVALDEAARGVMELKAAPASDAVCAAIAAIPKKLGRMPLIILDQFDDYQTRHRERFLPRKTWLKPGRLCEQNSAWRDLRELLASATIHLVIFTRTDTSLGLTSVRFIEPGTYRLDRLSSHFVGPLLAALAKEGSEQPVIGDPEYGWTTLLTRLAADLERAGTILPQQLKIVLAGLGTLPGRVLTVAAYERAGGAAGLEARFIEDRIAKVARLHGVTEEGVRAALLSLVDPETGQKTIERRNDDLLLCIDPAAPEKARPAHDQLAQDEVIRRRVDPGTGESSWLLDHDYLARAVREADRRANRWQRALAEGAKTLADAGDSWARWWRALLPPRTQLGFLYDRLRGRFRYGEHRLYAAKSLQRFGPIVGILLLVAAAEWESRAEERVAKSAEAILNGLEFPEFFGVSESDVEALLHLAAAEEPVRQRVLTLVLTNPERARVFVRAPESVIRAIAGTSPRFRELARALMASASAVSSSNRLETSTALADTSHLVQQTASVPLVWWAAAFSNTTDPDALRAFGVGLKDITGKLTDNQAKDALSSFRAAIQHATSGTTSVSNLRALDVGLEALAGALTDSQAMDALEPFLAAIIGSTNPFAVGSLGKGLAALPAALTDGQAKDALEPLLAAIQGTTNIYALYELGEALSALTAKFTDTQSNQAIGPFLVAIKGSTDDGALKALGAGLKSLAGKLTNSQASQAVEPFLAAIKSVTYPDTLQLLGEGLGALRTKLTDSQATEALKSFLHVIGSANIPLTASDPFQALSKGLGAVAAKFTDNQARDAVEPTLAAIEGAKEPGALMSLGMGLGALPITGSQVKEAVEPLLAAIKSASDPRAVGFLAKELAALPVHLTDSQAKDAIKPLLAAAGATKDRDDPEVLAEGLSALSAKLAENQAKEALDLILASIKSVTGANALRILGGGLGALPVKLTDSQTEAAIKPFLAAIKGAKDHTLGAKDEPDLIFAAVMGIRYPSALQVLGEGLGALSAKLEPTSAKAAQVIVNGILERTRNKETFAIYAELSAKLTRGRSRDERVTRIFHLLRHPLAAGEPSTADLLTLLEQVPGVQTKFGGDLWRAVEWAEAEQKAGRLSGLDLDGPLKIN